MAQDQTPLKSGDAPCIMCGNDKVIPQKATIAGERRSVCVICAGVGATLRKEGALEPVRHCLHLLAMEIEAFVGDGDNLTNNYFRLRSRIRARFNESYYRQNCPCDTCNGRSDPNAISDLHAHFGVEKERSAEDMDWLTLKAFKPSEKLIASDGSTWRAIDEISRRIVTNHTDTFYNQVEPGGLADRAGPKVPGEWVIGPDGSDHFQRVDPASRRARDAASRAYWSGLAHFGGGYPQGDYWVDPDGVCHPWGLQ